MLAVAAGWMRPPLNPIEGLPKIKHWKRRAHGRARGFWRHIGHLVSTIEPGGCENYFADAGQLPFEWIMEACLMGKGISLRAVSPLLEGNAAHPRSDIQKRLVQTEVCR